MCQFKVSVTNADPDLLDRKTNLWCECPSIDMSIPKYELECIFTVFWDIISILWEQLFEIQNNNNKIASKIVSLD